MAATIYRAGLRGRHRALDRFKDEGMRRRARVLRSRIDARFQGVFEADGGGRHGAPFGQGLWSM